METQLVDLTIITFNIARGGTFERTRIDRAPAAILSGVGLALWR
jgi:hypothetical protein